MITCKTVIVLLGLPSSGKSMLGAHLENLGYPFLPEVTESLILGGLTAGERAGPDFDRIVMSLEFARDLRFCRSNHKVEVVETWHPGNIAYATARSSSIVPIYRNRFLCALKKLEAKCLVLDTSSRTSYLRSLELQKPTVNSISFLKKVQELIIGVIEEFGLESVTIDSTKSPEHMKSEALEVIQSWIKNIKR